MMGIKYLQRIVCEGPHSLARFSRSPTEGFFPGVLYAPDAGTEAFLFAFPARAEAGNQRALGRCMQARATDANNLLPSWPV